MTKRKSILYMILIFMCVTLMGCSQEERKNVDMGVERDNELFVHFQKKYPENAVIKCGYEDVTNDGAKDLVVIYNIEKGKNGMKVVVGGDEYSISNEVPAPAEDQIIKFKNIDDKDEIEFIVSGSKHGNVGYAIFRFQQMEIINLFGQDMEDCC
ncbi:hypothetical protein SAMN02745945_02010 [Peptoclostridium litorale DSM 5388]|uniref:Putative lipoprotein n=1 Tax=Peptoclostridium litorale DSM 5388 TaxID=1121324 RepID=A0A069RJF1_PEPLI|nr:Cys-Cys-COOH (seleno)protein SaoC [Peptoclostridium litorale]KDR96280.1 putative lipoprotein [Peptoclostridium litorale DSM 5388]SIO15074.1 hypothetical protein SAMN02745945_02010 [Peptoclostridium litorale DSM 5388]